MSDVFDIDEFCDVTGVAPRDTSEDFKQPWMKHHNFVLVRTPEEVKDIVDRALEAGVVALDTETNGLDTRIEVQDGKLRTRHKIVGYCICYDGVTGYYIPVRHYRNGVYKIDLNVPDVPFVDAQITRLCHAAQPTLDPNSEDPIFGKPVTSPKVKILFWNAKFDQEMLYPVTGIETWHPDGFEDGMLASNLQGFNVSGWNGLKETAEEHLKDPDGNPYKMIEFKSLFLGNKTMDFGTVGADEPATKFYAGSDAICTWLLCQKTNLITNMYGQLYERTYRMEKSVIQVVRNIERNRIKVDRDEVQKVLDEALQEQAQYAAKINALAESKGFSGFNPASNDDKSELLFGEKGLDLKPKPEKTSENSKLYKTDAATLEKFVEELDDIEAENHVVTWLIKYAQIGKSIGTYLRNILEHADDLDQLRLEFNQNGAVTGRFSAPSGDTAHGYGGVPIQGIPARTDPRKPKVSQSMRRMFVARDGYILVKIDYAGQELRIAANVSQEPVWIHEFLHGDGDLHSITARAFFGKEEITKDERRSGKTANFALLYGGGYMAIIRATGCTKLEAQRRKAAFDRALPVFSSWVQIQHSKIKKNKGVLTAFGRWIPVPDVDIKAGDPILTSKSGALHTESQARGIQASCERYSVNYAIQSAGADIMKTSLVRLYKRFLLNKWLRNGDDSVRMVLTVHDEIVFEIKKERLQEALSVIVPIMESPTKIPQNPRWKVPLIVDVSLGLNWEAKYEWADLAIGKTMKPGTALKDNEYEAYGRIYKRPPKWLEGYVTPIEPVEAVPVAKVAAEAPAEVPSTTILPPAPSPSMIPIPEVSVVASSVPYVPEPAPSVPEEYAPSKSVPPEDAITYVFDNLTENTAKVLKSRFILINRPDGVPLRLVTSTGIVLLDVGKGIRVDEKEFRFDMKVHCLVMRKAINYYGGVPKNVEGLPANL